MSALLTPSQYGLLFCCFFFFFFTMSGVEVVKSQATFDDSRIQSWTAEATFDDSRIQWTEAKSAKGATYLIGRPKDHAGPAAAASEAKGVVLTADLSDPEKNVDVNWPYTVDGESWKDTTQYEKDTLYITRYSLHGNSGWYNHILEFTNTQSMWNYRFYDETGDSYSLMCYRATYHYVKYNSDEPSINHVRMQCQSPFPCN